MKNKSAVTLLVIGVVLLIVAGILLHSTGIFGVLAHDAGAFANNANTVDGQILSSIVLIGLALIVVLVAILAIIYAVIGVTNKDQALALPEGSVRSLIAFSLILIFVCLGSFLYKGVSSPDVAAVQTLDCQTKDRIDELVKNFTVVYQPSSSSCPAEEKKAANKANGDQAPPTAEKPVEYQATLYSKHSKDGDDFAKLMFNTLSTLLVGILSFYYGSKATASGVDAGANAAGGQTGKKPDPSGPKDPQTALDGTKAAAHDAKADADRAQKAASDARAAQNSDVQNASKDASTASSTAMAQVDVASKAFNDFNAAKTPADKDTASAAIFKALETANHAAAAAKADADKAEQVLKQAS